MNFYLFKSQYKSFVILLFSVFIISDALSQLPSYYREEVKNNNGSLMTTNIQFGVHLTAGDMADRFGGHMSTGLGMDYITSKDWIVGAHWNFYFGSNVKEDVLLSLRNEEGFIFGGNQEVASVFLRQRGVSLGGHLGKIFRLNKSKRSGIRATVGAGLYQHKIRIQDDPVVNVPQLSKEYKKGYDRLSNGLGLTQFIGYQHLGAFRRANFIVGFEFTEAFTQNRRNFNFDERAENNDSRFDFSYGLRMTWVLPFYLGESADEIRY